MTNLVSCQAAVTFLGKAEGFAPGKELPRRFGGEDSLSEDCDFGRAEAPIEVIFLGLVLWFRLLSRLASSSSGRKRHHVLFQKYALVLDCRNNCHLAGAIGGAAKNPGDGDRRTFWRGVEGCRRHATGEPRRQIARPLLRPAGARFRIL